MFAYEIFGKFLRGTTIVNPETQTLNPETLQQAGPLLLDRTYPISPQIRKIGHVPIVGAGHFERTRKDELLKVLLKARSDPEPLTPNPKA